MSEELIEKRRELHMEILIDRKRIEAHTSIKAATDVVSKCAHFGGLDYEDSIEIQREIVPRLEKIVNKYGRHTDAARWKIERMVDALIDSVSDGQESNR